MQHGTVIGLWEPEDPHAPKQMRVQPGRVNPAEWGSGRLSDSQALQHPELLLSWELELSCNQAMI